MRCDQSVDQVFGIWHAIALDAAWREAWSRRRCVFGGVLCIVIVCGCEACVVSVCGWCVVQTLVFTLLTVVYIALAIEHSEEAH